MTDKQIEILARKAEREENNELARILYTYLGSKHVGMGSEFARYCQVFAKEGFKEIEKYKNEEEAQDLFKSKNGNQVDGSRL